MIHNVIAFSHFLGSMKVSSHKIDHFFHFLKGERCVIKLTTTVIKVDMDRREWDAGTQLDRTDPELFDFNSEVEFFV